LLLPRGLKCTNRIYPRELKPHWPHFLELIQHLQQRRSLGCLGRAFFSCVPKCTNYFKECDIKILYPPPHITYVLRTLDRTVSKPFKTKCHQETIKLIYNSANNAITKFSFKKHFSELLG
jgi:hypothetical protein